MTSFQVCCLNVLLSVSPPQRGRAASQESRFNRSKLHRGQPALLTGLHVALQPARVRPEASVRQDPLVRGVRQASEPGSGAAALGRQDGRLQPESHGGHPRHGSCPDEGRFDRLADCLHGNGLCKDGIERKEVDKSWDGRTRLILSSLLFTYGDILCVRRPGSAVVLRCTQHSK